MVRLLADSYKVYPKVNVGIRVITVHEDTDPVPVIKMDSFGNS